MPSKDQPSTYRKTHRPGDNKSQNNHYNDKKEEYVLSVNCLPLPLHILVPVLPSPTSMCINMTKFKQCAYTNRLEWSIRILFMSFLQKVSSVSVYNFLTVYV